MAAGVRNTAIIIAALFLSLAPAGARAAANPYAHVPAAGDHVRFDGSAGGERMAWAYTGVFDLEVFLRSTIDAAISSTSYDDYQKKMSRVLARSLVLSNGDRGRVVRVQQFAYRDHQDVEVQVRVESGPLTHSLVFTTPAELVDPTGRRYLR